MRVGTHLVIEGNAFYEIDDECVKSMERQRRKNCGVEMEAPDTGEKDDAKRRFNGYE